ncbi:hypothetical protein ACEPAI_772 [Sanghuangporus weigelae]
MNAENEDKDERQCRICFDGPESGRLIRPCYCRGSIAYIHVECLQRWRRESQSAFYRCPQCHYKYRTARTSVLGLAENPVIIASLSVFLFTCLAYIASFTVTFFMSEDYTPRSTFFFFGWNWVTPDEVAYNLMRIVLRILRDEDIIIDENTLRAPLRAAPTKPITPRKLGAFANFIHRIIIGIPVLGVASLVQLFWSMSFLGPVNLLARRLGRGRNRRESSRDIATLIILGAIILGALRALRGVYRLTERAVRWGLTRTEGLILEVQ